jgi:hypothetical protein
MSVTTQQYISLIGSETETLSKAVALHLMDSTASLGSIVMQSSALYFESKQLVKSVKKNDASAIIDADDTLTDYLRGCQETIKSAYSKMGDLIENDRLINPLNKMMMPVSRWLLKKSFDNYGLAVIYIMEHDVDADKSPYSEAFDTVDELMKHLNS